MCGLVAAIGPESRDLTAAVACLDHRGPDAHGVVTVGSVTLGHARLAILDLDPRSDQPFTYGSVTVAYNGELWNYQRIRSELVEEGLQFATTGDTEVVAAALHHWGPGALGRFEAMFAIAWTDGTVLHLARDRFGEVPLHAWGDADGFVAASERKALRALGLNRAVDVGPGEHWTVTATGARTVTRWYQPPVQPAGLTRADAAVHLRGLLHRAVTERAIADRPVCVLLSGGIDSAIIATELAPLVPDLVAYTAVHDSNSRDLRTARLLADHLGIKLVEVPVPAPSADDLAEVIRVIEMPYKAQVEIGWACLQLAERIAADGYRVTFSGEGSDELWASYGFCYHALKTADWHLYRRDLFLTQARKNFPRANKVFLAHGVECRLPFLHSPVVEFALSLTETTVADRSGGKDILAAAYRGIIPAEVLDRPKVAFQDGMGLKSAIAARITDPLRFYRAEYTSTYEGAGR